VLHKIGPLAAGLLATVLAGWGVAQADGNKEPTLRRTTEQWRQDLQYFARELPRRHANAFHHVSRERFEAEVADLDRRLDGLDGDEVYVGLDRIANLIGDGHTYVAFPADMANLPLDVARFGDDYRVTHVAGGLEKALGARVLKVQGQPVARVHERLLALTPQDETPELRQARAASFLTVGMVLHGFKVIPDRNIAQYTLADDAGREFTVEAHALPPGAKPRWLTAYQEPPLFRQRPGESFWYAYLPEARAVYCSFRAYDGLPRKAAGLWKLVEERHPDKLVIDMRLNGGGDYTVGLHYLVNPIRNRASLNNKGHLFVLIGTNTFSAAMSNAAHFRTRTAALLVGQTIGEKPNSYQEVRQMTLPSSQLVVRYSTRYYKFIEGGENVIRPDKEIIPSWDEYKAGRDPVLEWVLKYPAG
jgi:hypothetical protein